MELVWLVFAEPFKTSFLIDPTGIKLSRFSSKSGYSIYNFLQCMHHLHQLRCCVHSNFLASAAHLNRLFGGKGVGILCCWELKDHLVWLQVDWSQVANETTLNPVFYFLILGKKKEHLKLSWNLNNFLGIDLDWSQSSLPEALLKCQLPLKEKETAISFHLRI